MTNQTKKEDLLCMPYKEKCCTEDFSPSIQHPFLRFYNSMIPLSLITIPHITDHIMQDFPKRPAPSPPPQPNSVM